jgi:hypothetical protein
MREIGCCINCKTYAAIKSRRRKVVLYVNEIEKNYEVDVVSSFSNCGVPEENKSVTRDSRIPQYDSRLMSDE